jgi:hypothetical protein
MATQARNVAADTIRIQPPNFGRATFVIVGTHPYVQNRFGGPGRDTMRDKQLAGSTAATSGARGKKRAPKDVDALFVGCQHVADAGWRGIPAPAFRAALISACRLVGFKMTMAKLSVFCEADGFESADGTPLVEITRGKPRLVEHSVRNATGVADLRFRPMWDPGWEARPTLRWDADQFSVSDVTNLLMRAGQQVGIGEGRPDSRMSSGMDWGLFRVDSAEPPPTTGARTNAAGKRPSGRKARG